MSSAAGFVVLDALVLVVGLSVLAACGVRVATRLGIVALAFVTGWAALGLAWTLAAIGGSPLARWQAIVVGAAVAGGAAAVAWRRPRAVAEKDERSVQGPLARSAAVGAVFVLALLLAAGCARATTAEANMEKLASSAGDPNPAATRAYESDATNCSPYGPSSEVLSPA